VLVFDDSSLTDFVFIQPLTESHDSFFSIVIPVVVGSSPISHPSPRFRERPNAPHRAAGASAPFALMGTSPR
jgi:hypothetical protein